MRFDTIYLKNNHNIFFDLGIKLLIKKIFGNLSKILGNLSKKLTIFMPFPSRIFKVLIRLGKEKMHIVFTDLKSEQKDMFYHHPKQSEMSSFKQSQHKKILVY